MVKSACDFTTTPAGWECRGHGIHYHEASGTLHICCVEMQGGPSPADRLTGREGPWVAAMVKLRTFREANPGRPVYSVSTCIDCWERG